MLKDYNYYLEMYNNDPAYSHVPLAEKQAYAMKDVTADRINTMTAEEYDKHLEKVCKEYHTKLSR